MHQSGPISVVWFKRDLRLTDHAPLKAAIEKGLPVLMLYVFEPSLMRAPDCEIRHLRFVWQSLMDLENDLVKYESKLCIAVGEVVDVMTQIHAKFNVAHVFAHQEIGVKITFDRDISVAKFCNQHHITFNEFQRDGVQRGLRNRKTWNKDWKDFMSQLTQQPDWSDFIKVGSDEIIEFDNRGAVPNEVKTPHPAFQPGGSKYARQYLSSFLQGRMFNYMKHISKPQLSRTACSRLSPYLAWGNMSMRELIHAATNEHGKGNKRILSFYIARLHWHCHFIQKFESECRMEYENLNTTFNNIRTAWNEEYFEAWKTGKTGYPLVDACMRCVMATGYVNFRMRSMLVTFLTHNLWLDWQKGAIHLARQFLDYEPGIHYSQFQMQSGTMGVNIIRTYNPLKQSLDHDTNGDFIRQWVPELANVPAPFIHQPWLIPDSLQQQYKCIIGIDYPMPIVDLKSSAQHAATHLWQTKKSLETRQQNQRILEVHTHRKTEREKLITSRSGKTKTKIDLNHKLF
jgi:deoxyribodipyrimidine photo-lyase